MRNLSSGIVVSVADTDRAACRFGLDLQFTVCRLLPISVAQKLKQRN